MKRYHSRTEDAFHSSFTDLFSNTIALLIFFFFVVIIFQFLMNYQISQMQKNADQDIINVMETRQKEKQLKDEEITKINQIISSLEGKIIKSDELLKEKDKKVLTLQEELHLLNNEIQKLNMVLEYDKVQMEKKDIEIVELGKKLNRALANKTVEFMEAKSEFFQELNSALSDFDEAEKKGDRYILSSELLFAQSEAKLNEKGKKELNKLAALIKKMITKIPSQTEWILRIDGHTDNIRISKNNKQFRDNTELSLARAQEVRNYLIRQGINGKYLLPSGFGPNNPLVPNTSKENRALNRRIEFQITNK